MNTGSVGFLVVCGVTTQYYSTKEKGKIYGQVFLAKGYGMVKGNVAAGNGSGVSFVVTECDGCQVSRVTGSSVAHEQSMLEHVEHGGPCASAAPDPGYIRSYLTGLRLQSGLAYQEPSFIASFLLFATI